MNPFTSLVPPNMDSECFTAYVYNLSGTVSSTDMICSDPWNYYKAYGFDIVVVALTVTLVCIALIGYRHK